MHGAMDWTLKLFTGDPTSVDEPVRVKKAAPAPKKLSERDLLRKESMIGQQLFGPLPKGHQREFFCLDTRTWIWYERWIDDESKAPREQTTRYEIHSNGIIKIQEDQLYKVLEGQELKNLERAIELYHEKVMREVYGRSPLSGEKLVASTA